MLSGDRVASRDESRMWFMLEAMCYHAATVSARRSKSIFGKSDAWIWSVGCMSIRAARQMIGVDGMSDAAAASAANDGALTPRFVHLRVHSAYSLLEGALPLGKIIKQAIADAAPAIAVPDTNHP